MMECANCGYVYDHTKYRWRCPKCGFKANCCEGEPQMNNVPGLVLIAIFSLVVIALYAELEHLWEHRKK